LVYLPTAVYLLCFATSGACAILLGRAYRKTSARLLFWSCLCFGLLACNNLVVILDMLVIPTVDLRALRIGFALAAVAVLIIGFVWDLQE
jgi:hypothetical protein